MWHHETLFPVYAGKDVTMSPVLKAALMCAKMTADDLVQRMMYAGGRLVLGADHVADVGLLTAVPRGSTVHGSGSSIDFATPRHRRALKFEYCEADGLPFLKVPGVTLPETVIQSLPGRRLSGVVGGMFDALRLADPIIETATNSVEGGFGELDLVFSMDWVTVPLMRYRGL